MLLKPGAHVPPRILVPESSSAPPIILSFLKTRALSFFSSFRLGSDRLPDSDVCLLESEHLASSRVLTSYTSLQGHHLPPLAGQP